MVNKQDYKWVALLLLLLLLGGGCYWTGQIDGGNGNEETTTTTIAYATTTTVPADPCDAKCREAGYESGYTANIAHPCITPDVSINFGTISPLYCCCHAENAECTNYDADAGGLVEQAQMPSVCVDPTGTYYDFCSNARVINEYICSRSGLCEYQVIKCNEINADYYCLNTGMTAYCGPLV